MHPREKQGDFYRECLADNLFEHQMPCMKFHYSGKEFSSEMPPTDDVKLDLAPCSLFLVGLSKNFEVNKQKLTVMSKKGF